MTTTKSILLCVIVILGLVTAYLSMHGFDIVSDHITHMFKEINRDDLYTVKVDNRILIAFLKDFSVKTLIYRSITKWLFVAMVALILPYGFCLYKGRRTKKIKDKDGNSIA